MEKVTLKTRIRRFFDMGYEHEFQLAQKEKILVETQDVYATTSEMMFVTYFILGIGIGAPIAAAILLNLFLSGESLLLFISLLLFAFSIFFTPLSFLITYDYVFQRKRVFFYLTNLRVVKFIRKGQLQLKDKYKDLKYSELACIRPTAAIHYDFTFFAVKPDKTCFITITDIQFPVLSKYHEKIVISLKKKEAVKFWQDIIDFLIPSIPLIPHPHIDRLLLNKKFVSPTFSGDK